MPKYETIRQTLNVLHDIVQEQSEELDMMQTTINDLHYQQNEFFNDYIDDPNEIELIGKMYQEASDMLFLFE